MGGQLQTLDCSHVIQTLYVRMGRQLQTLYVRMLYKLYMSGWVVNYKLYTAVMLYKLYMSGWVVNYKLWRSEEEREQTSFIELQTCNLVMKN
jgi:hypothetical protein